MFLRSCFAVRYSVVHTTTYRYDRPITLAPHLLRLQPRSDIAQRLVSFSLDITPSPEQLFENIELDGNAALRLLFSDHPLQTFRIQTSFTVETYRTNPFDFLIEPWAAQLPFNYPSTLLAQLQPYLGGWGSNFPGLDPIAIQLAQEIWQDTAGNPIAFLWELNQRIFTTCKHIVRETGEPFPPGVTWQTKTASCRDMTVLFMEVCRAMGLAARFVSGYHEGDPDWEERHLHAWAEVYLPGAGWRGYDPTQGLAVGDRYITLVAAPNSRYAAPVSGTLKTGIGANSELEHDLTIEAIEQA